MFVKRLALGGFFNWDNIFVMCYVFPLVVRACKSGQRKFTCSTHAMLVKK